MRVTWDAQAKAVYIYIKENAEEHGKTKEIDDSPNLDYDKAGNLNFGLKYSKANFGDN